ncbi:MAG TPA: hypothetical protein VJG64_00520 [Candidatus Paceibacterota bacterium]
MVTLAPSVTHSDDKGRKFMDIVGTAYDKAKLPEDEAQNVNDAPGLAEVVAGFIADNRSSNKYKKEEVKPRWPYPASYKREAIERQIDILRSAANFPFIDPDPAIKYYREVYGSLRQPEWVEGPFIIMPTSTLAKHFFPEITDVADQHCRAVNIGIEKLGASRPFHNWRAGEITTDRFRRKARYVPMYDRLYATQPNSDLIVVGGQYGKFHGGQPMRRALERMQGQVSELPAGALEGVVMALANPTRYSKWEELDTDLPADEFRPGDEAGFSVSPYLSFGGDRLRFGMRGVGGPLERYGSVSVSVPQ